MPSLHLCLSKSGDLVGFNYVIPQLRRTGLDDRRCRRVAAAAVDRRLVEEGSELVILALGERIEFMVVATTAVERQAKPNRAHRLGHIEDIIDAILLGNAAALAVNHVIAVEAGSQDLIVRRIRQKITGQLLDGELIERHVVVERTNHPVAPGPHRTLAVTLIAVGVGVASRLQPVPRHAFAIGRRRQRAGHEPVPRAWLVVLKKTLHLSRSRWQAGQVEFQSADQRPAISPRVGLHKVGLQLAVDEFIDRVHPRLAKRRPLDPLERPMPPPLGTLFHPLFQRLDLFRGQRPTHIRRWHQVVHIRSGDPGEQFALRRVGGVEHAVAVAVALGIELVVQPKITLSCFFRVWAVTVKTLVRKDREDVPRKINLPRCSRPRGQQCQQNGDGEHTPSQTPRFGLYEKHLRQKTTEKLATGSRLTTPSRPRRKG